MKVCLIAPASGWRGGMHQYSAHLANSLAEKADVEVIGYKRIFPLWFYPGDSKKLSGEVELRPEVSVHEIFKYYSILSSFRAAAAIKTIQPDVVDIQWIAPQHGLILIPLMSSLRRASTAKILLTVHNVLPHETWPFNRALSRWAFRLSDRILVHAESLKDELVKNFGENPDKIVTIPHGICANGDIRTTKARARGHLGIKEKLVILFFGFVRPYKGLEYLLEAFAKIRHRFDVALVIAGEFFEGPSRYQKKLEKEGILESTYLFPRYISYEEVSLFFSAADILVQPYVRFSGQSGVTQTAYMHSVPVVATSVGGLPELVLDKETGLVVKPRDSLELAHALETLLTDARKRRSYGENGRRFLDSHLTWESVTEKMLEIYAEA